MTTPSHLLQQKIIRVHASTILLVMWTQTEKQVKNDPNYPTLIYIIYTYMHIYLPYFHIYYIYIYIYICVCVYIYIYEQETSVCMCCVVKINRKHVCLTHFRILLILSHVCEW